MAQRHRDHSGSVNKVDIHQLIDTLPDDVIHRLENGHPVSLVAVIENGTSRLIEIDPDQTWFWTPEWQEGEREADEDIAAGRGTIYYSDEEFLAALEADLKPLG